MHMWLKIVIVTIGALYAGPQRWVEYLLPNASHDLYQGLWLANGHILQVRLWTHCYMHMYMLKLSHSAPCLYTVALQWTCVLLMVWLCRTVFDLAKTKQGVMTLEQETNTLNLTVFLGRTPLVSVLARVSIDCLCTLLCVACTIL